MVPLQDWIIERNSKLLVKTASFFHRGAIRNCSKNVFAGHPVHTVDNCKISFLNGDSFAHLFV